MQFKIEPALLRSCAPAMSNEETRYYLNGVHIFEKDGRLVYEATNGHMLVRITSFLEQENDLTGLNIIIPDFFVKELGKPSFLRGFGVIGLEWVDAVVEAQTISIEMPEGIASNKLIDGTFPESDKVFPAHRKGVNATPDLALNLEYVGKIAKSAKAFDNFCAQIAINDNTGPIYLSQKSERGEWEALLMPMRA